MFQLLGSGGAMAFCLIELGSNPGMDMAFFNAGRQAISETKKNIRCTFFLLFPVSHLLRIVNLSKLYQRTKE